MKNSPNVNTSATRVAHAVDVAAVIRFHSAMARGQIIPDDGQIRVAGSFGSAATLAAADLDRVAADCDIAEIRLDLVCGDMGAVEPETWSHLSGIPLLFTARCPREGGARALDTRTRMHLLETALPDAALIDIEVAGIAEMRPLLDKLAAAGIPWVASFHDFTETPPDAVLLEKLALAKQAGAAVFKVAAMLEGTADLARLADFQLADHGIAVATMGMGPLAPVSRLLCAQCGSVLNYGYLGETPTAPGQWDAASLKSAIARLTPVRRGVARIS
jgi:3-dehydroquinate dehydratase I